MHLRMREKNNQIHIKCVCNVYIYIIIYMCVCVYLYLCTRVLAHIDSFDPRGTVVTGALGFLTRIGSHEAQDDDILLTSLEGVH